MKVLLGSDVDPVLPPKLRERPADDVWACLDHVQALVERAGAELPPITWLLRADESVRFCTQDFDSAFTRREAMWRDLQTRGHELGWHMHLLSFSVTRGQCVFDATAPWLEEAHAALSRHFPTRASRTGWDYADGDLLRRLAGLGVTLDFSALPGARGWIEVGGDTVPVDWLVTPSAPYRPSRRDHRRPGRDPLPILEMPITQFRATPWEMTRRATWRALHREPSLLGLSRRTRMLTSPWPDVPRSDLDCMAFYFHPEHLAGEGLGHLLRNVARLRTLPDAEFVTASTLHAWLEPRVAKHAALLPEARG